MMTKSTLWKRIAIAFSSAYILLFFSEYFFVNEQPVTHLISTLTKRPFELVFIVEFILWYAFPSYFFLIALEKFQVDNIWAFCLSASLYGWIVEGIIASQLYESLPHSISWTSLGWHVIIDALIGWHLMQKLLQQNNVFITLLIALLLGLFWGLWATWYWSEDNFTPIQANDFALYAFFTTLLLIAAYCLLNKSLQEKFITSKAENWVLGFIAILSLGSWSYALALMPLYVFIPLCFLSLFALQSSKSTTANTILREHKKQINYIQYPLLLLMPVVASLTYYYLISTETIIPIAEFIVPILMFAGFIIYVIAWFKTYLK